VLGVMTAVIATPSALAATLGRGLLPGIATIIVLIASAQVFVLSGASYWYPIAAPAMWAFEPHAVPLLALMLALLVGLGFSALTMLTWSRLQLDR
jgi:ABC-2 type transport system permease protein